MMLSTPKPQVNQRNVLPWTFQIGRGTNSHGTISQITRANLGRRVGLFLHAMPSLHLQIPYRMKPNKSQLGKFVSGRQVSIILETSYYYLRELIQVMDNETKDTRRHARALLK